VIFSPIFQYNYRWLFGPEQGTAQNNGGWYAAFNVVSAYTNTGTSLLDESMVPFQRTYGWVIVVGLLILAGNTAFPIFLRSIIWILSKVTPKQSRFNETLQFLLDHPRRCFIYLFPSAQTWILVAMLVILNVTDLVGFLVLDIGTAVIEAIPAGTRVLDGLFQAFAVRAAGFSIVPLAETAPALKVLYVVMM
jgi:Trk-type K+ transport system membrane component